MVLLFVSWLWFVSVVLFVGRRRGGGGGGEGRLAPQMSQSKRENNCRLEGLAVTLLQRNMCW